MHRSGSDRSPSSLRRQTGLAFPARTSRRMTCHPRGDAKECKATATSSCVTVLEPSRRYRRAASSRIRFNTASVSARKRFRTACAAKSAVWREIGKSSPAIALSLVPTYEAIQLSCSPTHPSMHRRQLKRPAWPLTSFFSVNSAVVCSRTHRSSFGPLARISKRHLHSARTNSWSRWHRGVSSNVILILLINGVSDRLVPEDVRQSSISPYSQSQVSRRVIFSGYLYE